MDGWIDSQLASQIDRQIDRQIERQRVRERNTQRIRQRERENEPGPQPPSGPSFCHPCIHSNSSPIGFLSLKLPPPPCAVLLVLSGIIYLVNINNTHTHIYIYRSFSNYHIYYLNYMAIVGERDIYRQIDRQTVRCIDRQTDRQIDRQIEIITYNYTYDCQSKGPCGDWPLQRPPCARTILQYMMSLPI